MSTIGTLLFLYTETPLHAGAGTALGAVDLPLQREHLSGLPLVQSSGVKGSLREVFRSLNSSAAALLQDVPMNFSTKEQPKERWQELTTILFGPEPPSGTSGPNGKAGEEAEDAITHAGALSLSDARLLLLPVRTVFGGWAWTTCPLILSRLVRDMECLGKTKPIWYGSAEKLLYAVQPESDKTKPDRALGLIPQKGSRIAPSDRLLIEDTEYPVKPDKCVDELAKWLADHALPRTEAFTPFRERLAAQLVILNDEEFAYLSQHATEVVTRIRIDPVSGTVQDGALWTEENLPAESLLWNLGLLSSDRRPLKKSQQREVELKALEPEKLLACFQKGVEKTNRIRLGGDRTIGRGMLSVRLSQTAGAQP